MKLRREKSSLFGPVDRLVIELEGKEMNKNDLALLFDAYQIASESIGEPSKEILEIEIPSFVLHLYGSPATMWADLNAEFGYDGQPAGCVIGENPYHIYLCGLKEVGDKLTVNHLILGHEFLHLVKQVVADAKNNRDTQASIILDPDALPYLEG